MVPEQYSRSLEYSLVAYGAASLAHHIHNALYLHAYPNMPPWLTATMVGAVWCAITGVGVLGYWLYRHGSRMLGALTLTVYALLGFVGLDHYVVAPILAHTLAMHLTIASEAITATALLWCIARSTIAAPARPRSTTTSRP